MPVTFKEETRTSVYLDPFSQFCERERSVQIRRDPLTGAVSRVFTYRRRPPQQSEAEGKGKPPACAFCKENIETMTPMFPAGLCPEGRIRRGEAVVFPNLFPYDTHNAVVVISTQHEVGMGEWAFQRLADAMEAAREYIRRVTQARGGRCFYSVNWNFTPIAGASQVHPHLQIIVSKEPTREQKRLLEAGHEYMAANNANFWEELIRAEEAAGERYAGRTGDAHWLVNFAPRAFIPDVTAVLSGNTDFVQCGGHEIEALARGLVKLLNYYESRNVQGVNLALYSQSPGEEYFWTHVRVIPRLRIPPLNISDVNYFRLMHDEGLSLITPEQVCRELKPFFQGGH